MIPLRITKKERIKVYRVIAPNARRARFDVSAERGLTTFIGRERDLDFLLDSFERSKRGIGQAVSPFKVVLTIRKALFYLHIMFSMDFIIFVRR